MDRQILKLENLNSFLLQKKKTVFFVHGAGAANLLFKFKNNLDSRFYKIIPTSVQALFVLDQKNIPHEIPENYCDLRELHEYAKNIETKLEDFALKIDQKLQEKYPEIGKIGLRPALYNLFSFVRIFSPLADAHFKIKKIIEKENPDRIVVLSEEKQGKEQFREMLLWGADENIFKKIISTYYLKRAYFLDLGKKKSELQFFWGLGDKIKRHFLQNPRLFYLLKLFLTDKKSLLRSLFYSRKLKPLLLLNGEYEWSGCKEEFEKKGYFIYGATAGNFFSSFWKKNYYIDTEFLETKEDDADFLPLAKERWQSFFSQTVPSCLYAFKKTEKLVKRKKIEALLYCVNPDAISKSIAFSARKGGIKAVGWQHGDLNYRPTRSMAQNDLLESDLFLSWGKGSDENRRAVADELGLKKESIIVGSSSLDRILSSKPQSIKIFKKIGLKNNTRPLIVFATTMYYQSNTYNLWSDMIFYKIQKKMIDGLSQLEGNKIIKLHPSSFYAVSELDNYCNNLRKNDVFTIRRKISAPLLFSVADVIIIDMPSTTLLQAVASKKPVFCLTRFLKFESKTLEVLKKRAVLSENEGQLLEEIRLFLKSGKYKADLNNSEFLENYGTNLDCKAAKRAVDAVDKLIKENHV